MPTEKPKVFLCYARKDQGRVEGLYQKLSDAGFAPWMDSKDILPGEDWKQVLIKTIREAPFFLACLSNNSVNKRGVIQEEIREALDAWRQKLESDIYFIPIRLEECQVPEALAKFQWVDLFSDNDFKWLLQGLRAGIERLGVIQPIRLRSQPLDVLSREDVKKMLRENDLFDQSLYWMGKGVQHEFDEIIQHGERLVIDHTTGLTWQQSGSGADMGFERAQEYVPGAQEYVRELKDKKYAGYSDWRLPTLEEAMSLMEPSKNKDGLFINQIFGQEQPWIWTVDKWRQGPRQSSSYVRPYVWVVYFDYGSCDDYLVSRSHVYVRAVR